MFDRIVSKLLKLGLVRELTSIHLQRHLSVSSVYVAQVKLMYELPSLT